MAMKASGELMFGQVPALKVTSKTSDKESYLLTQTNAIIRFIGKLKPEKELYPANPIVAAKVDAVMDQDADAFMAATALRYASRNGFGVLDKEENKKIRDEARNDVITKVIPGHLEKLSALLKAGGTGWIAGTQKPSTADFMWGLRLKSLGEWLGEPKILENFPLLIEFVEKFFELEEVQTYYKNRK